MDLDKMFDIKRDFISIRQERIDETVAATQASLDIGNIDLTYMENLTEAKNAENELFNLLDQLKDTVSTEREKEMIVNEFEKLMELEETEFKKKA